jgi:hypothetical protein
MGHIRITGCSWVCAEVRDLSGTEPNGEGTHCEELFLFALVRYGTVIATQKPHSHCDRGSKPRHLGSEDYFMHRIDRYINSLFLAAAIAAPVIVVANANAQEASVQVRVYDRDHHDYHNWNDREDRAYRHYLVEQHRAYLEYHKLHHDVQRNYWNWRHSHPDYD